MKTFRKILIIVVSASLFCGAVFLLFTSSRVWTDSMEPTYPVGSYTFWNPFENPKVGDVIAFECMSESKCRSDYYRVLNGYIGHRLTSISSDGCWYIRGDNPKYNWDPNFCLYPNEMNLLGVSHKLTFASFVDILFGTSLSDDESPSVTSQTMYHEPYSKSDPENMAIQPVDEPSKVQVSAPIPRPVQVPTADEEKKNDTDVRDYEDIKFEIEMREMERDAIRRQEKAEKAAEKMAEYRVSHPGETCLFDSYGNATSCIPVKVNIPSPKKLSL